VATSFVKTVKITLCFDQQDPANCWREQFPIDLNRHLTAHKCQGQTFKNCLVGVDLGANSLSRQMPADLTALFYVACTRVNELHNLFIAPIHPGIWKEMGNTVHDVNRRKHEGQLEAAALAFAKKNRMKKEYSEDQEQVTGDHTSEWKKITDSQHPPAFQNITSKCEIITDTSGDPYHDFVIQPVSLDAEDIPECLTPVTTERHIGIDQGIVNFAMVAVDKIGDRRPEIVGVEHHNLQEEAGLDRKTATVTDVVMALDRHTDLLKWMQAPGRSPVLQKVDRVIVHIEQIHKRSSLNKLMGAVMGRALQRLVDHTICVVKMSMPNVHRDLGPMFKLGQDIVSHCDLQPALYGSDKSIAIQEARRRPVRTQTVVAQLPASTGSTSAMASTSQQDDDVEPDSDVESDATDFSMHCVDRQPTNPQWRQYVSKKMMSTRLFRYLMEEMPRIEDTDITVTVEPTVQQRWATQTAVTKFDDLGDATLHALNELLCGSGAYRQLIPAISTLHDNRTIVLKVVPDRLHFVILHCSWNIVTVEDLQAIKLDFPITTHFKECAPTVADILERHVGDLIKDGEEKRGHRSADIIKVVVKQLTAYKSSKEFTAYKAGCLTQSTFNAVQMLIEKLATENKCILAKTTRQDPKQGKIIIFSLSSGLKYHLNKSTGKHTNAIMSCMAWMDESSSKMVQRSLHLPAAKKREFFLKLKEVANQPVDEYGFHQLEQLRLDGPALNKFRSSKLSTDDETTLGDLLLIGLNKNMPHVGAIATHYRRPSAHETVPQPTRENRDSTAPSTSPAYR
jgi:hypothetical protein